MLYDYNPPTFLTEELLNEELEKFKWSEKYSIDWASNGLMVVFPKCKVYFQEGFESNMSASIFDLTFKKKYWEIYDLVNYVYEPIKQNENSFVEPEYHHRMDGFASEEKVRCGIEDLCLTIQTYLMDCINGDFSAAYEYEKDNPSAYGVHYPPTE